MSEKRIQAARANGAKSRGPITPEGKGPLFPQCDHSWSALSICRDPRRGSCGFPETLDCHLAKFAPADDTELEIVEEMAVANWRQRRLWTVETCLFTDATNARPSGNPPRAHDRCVLSPRRQRPARLLYRYETRLHMM